MDTDAQVLENIMLKKIVDLAHEFYQRPKNIKEFEKWRKKNARGNNHNNATDRANG